MREERAREHSLRKKNPFIPGEMSVRPKGKVVLDEGILPAGKGKHKWARVVAFPEPRGKHMGVIRLPREEESKVVQSRKVKTAEEHNHHFRGEDPIIIKDMGERTKQGGGRSKESGGGLSPPQMFLIRCHEKVGPSQKYVKLDGIHQNR